jgi:preprotein translocase subunit SecF
MTPATTVDRRQGVLATLRDVYHERTRFDFLGRKWIWGAVSGVAILISVATLVFSGLNLGIDFEGGTQWQLTVKSGSVSASDVRDALQGTGLSDPRILILGSDGVRVQAGTLKAADAAKVTAALATYGHVADTDVSVTDVGPTWGGQVSRKALIALVVFFFLIAAYLTFRFEWRMAVAAIVAVIHDIVITVGVYAVTRFEVTPATVVAFLTILGFSLYDTVVVFDKIKENVSTLGVERGDTYSAMVNRSMNQVLMRSLNTSFVALLPVTSLLFVGSGILGAVTLRDFALALFVGLFVGAYSSIFIATPILAGLKEREPRNRALRERATIQRGRDAVPSGSGSAPEAVPPVIEERSEPGRVRPDAAPPTAARPSDARGRAPSNVVTPRPRQQRRRKRR